MGWGSKSGPQRLVNFGQTWQAAENDPNRLRIDHPQVLDRVSTSKKREGSVVEIKCRQKLFRSPSEKRITLSVTRRLTRGFFNQEIEERS